MPVSFFFLLRAGFDIELFSDRRGGSSLRREIFGRERLRALSSSLSSYVSLPEVFVFDLVKFKSGSLSELVPKRLSNGLRLAGGGVVIFRFPA